MFAYECVNLLIFIKVVPMFLSNAPVQWAAERNIFGVGGVNGTVK